MSSEHPNSSIHPEKEQHQEDSVLKDAIDPQDLAYTSGSVSNPDELRSNPAVVPQTLDEPADIREGFKFDTDADTD